MSRIKLLPIITRGDREFAFDGIMQSPRDADKREWEVASGGSFEAALLDALDGPSAWMLTYGYRTVLCAFGVNPSGLPGVGNAWLVANRTAPNFAHGLHRHFNDGLEKMLALYPTLHAWADGRNSLHHLWMLRMGFELTENIMYFGEEGVPFLLFTINQEMHQRCASQARH